MLSGSTHRLCVPGLLGRRIGARGMGRSNSGFVWADGTVAAAFESWASGEPLRGAGWCAYMLTSTCRGTHAVIMGLQSPPHTRFVRLCS